jgi:ketosteroid isomerase-like protein
MRYLGIICLFAGICVHGAWSAETSSLQIDRDIWSEIRRTVIEADIEGMAATYHPDAVLVGRDGTVPIAGQLVKWGEDMELAKEEGSTATVEFRFASRQDDSTTAFERGLFKYSVIPASGPEVSSYVEFETLMIKKDGRWLILMERQLRDVDESAWTALDHYSRHMTDRLVEDEK